MKDDTRWAFFWDLFAIIGSTVGFVSAMFLLLSIFLDNPYDDVHPKGQFVLSILTAICIPALTRATNRKLFKSMDTNS